MNSKYRLILIGAVAAVTLTGAGAVFAQNVQVAHLAPFAEDVEDTAVDISVNGNPIPELQGVQFGQFVEIQAGGAPEINVDVFPVGADDPVISETVALGEDVTILAVGDGVRQDIGLLRLSDSVDAPDAGNVNLRVVHAAPFAAELADTEVSIRTAGGKVINGLAGVPFGASSGFFQLPAGTADVKVASPDGATNLIDPLPVELPDGANVTVVAIGNDDQQPLGAFALPGIGQLATRAPVDNSVNGLWDTVNTSNEGLFLQPLPAQNRLVGTIYTYDNGEPRWFTFDSCSPEPEDPAFECLNPAAFDGIEGEGTIYESTGGEFNTNESVDVNPVGVFGIEFTGCQSGNILIDLDDRDPITWELRHLAVNTPCTLDETLADDVSGSRQ